MRGAGAAAVRRGRAWQLLRRGVRVRWVAGVDADVLHAAAAVAAAAHASAVSAAVAAAADSAAAVSSVAVAASADAAASVSARALSSSADASTAVAARAVASAAYAAASVASAADAAASAADSAAPVRDDGRRVPRSGAASAGRQLVRVVVWCAARRHGAERLARGQRGGGESVGGGVLRGVRFAADLQRLCALLWPLLPQGRRASADVAGRSHGVPSQRRRVNGGHAASAAGRDVGVRRRAGGSRGGALLRRGRQLRRLDLPVCARVSDGHRRL